MNKKKRKVEYEIKYATEEDVLKGDAVYIGEIMPIPPKKRTTKWARQWIDGRLVVFLRPKETN